MHRPLSSLALLVLALPASAQTVWTVDDDGPADFTDIEDAIDAAGEGDVVLVRDGIYSEFRITGKSVSVIGEAGHRPNVSEKVIGAGLGGAVVGIGFLAPGQEVYLRNLEIGGTYFHAFSRGPYMSFGTNEGEIWIEDVVLGSNALPGFPAKAFTGIEATNCAAIHVSRSTLFAAGASASQGYGEALDVVDSNVSLWDTSLTAGNAAVLETTPGAPAARIEGGTLFAAGCQFYGGDGSTDQDGGHGLEISGGGLVRLRDCVKQGGLGPGAGTNGLPSFVASGTLAPIGGTTRTLELSSPVRAGIDGVSEVYRGEPGDLVYLLWSYTGSMAPLYLSIEHGAFTIDVTTLDGVYVGTLGPSGEISSTIPPLALGALDTFGYACQASFFKPGVGFFLSAPSYVTVVGAGF